MVCDKMHSTNNI